MSKTIGPYRLNPRGDYNPAADPLYSLLDLVSDGGGSFVYINDTPSNEPTSSASHWQQIASRGMTGPSAYDAAVAGEYTGTEAEFNDANAGIEAAKDAALGAAETANDAAENAETAAYRSMLWRKTASGNPVSVYPMPESPLYPKVSGTFTQEGTDDPSPSNIRQITPWLASGGTTKFKRTGKNLFNRVSHSVINATLIESDDNYAIVQGNAGSTPGTTSITNGVYRPNYSSTPANRLLYIVGGVTYTVSADITLIEKHEAASLTIGIYLNDLTGIASPMVLGTKVRLSGTVSATVAGYYYPIFTLNSCKVKIENVQVELGSITTSYEPYTEQEITLTAPQEIAAGWMDNEGQGQATWFKKVFDGTESLGGTITVPNADYASVSANTGFPAMTTANVADIASSHFTAVLLTSGIATEGVWPNASGNFGFVIALSRLSTYGATADRATHPAAMQAYLAAQYAAGTPVVVAYKLRTITTLTPASAPLTALPQLDRITPRQNVLTASTGNVELTYAKSPIRESDDIAAAIAAL